VPLTGKTDLRFIAEALSAEGVTQTQIWERRGENSNSYLSERERAISKGSEFHVLPSARERCKLF
jgi:hypothetical protein